MKSILLTGGCGFIGSHTCVSLLKSKDHSGLSNKTIFQFMDIIENIN